jgi:phosphatidylserine/phosphatidylglycerophosphate/cardiolipin synthase-like enzyme
MPPIAQNYQPVVMPSESIQDFTASALVGVNSLMLGWSIADNIDRKKLLGFGIRRTDYDGVTNEEIRSEWFYGNKRFEFQANAGFGATIPSYLAPFQRFNWNDYTLDPTKSYKYEIVPFWDDPKNMKRSTPIELMVKPSANKEGVFSAFTNRGVTSAHAYLERFKSNFDPKTNTDAQVWLSRGLKESLLDFIQHAQSGDGLHVAIYEFEDLDVAKALEKAKNKGVDVHIVYHANDPKQKLENEHTLSAANLNTAANCTARDKIINISHNKFVILLKNGTPKALWSGTCNFTFNGFYLQTNMALEINNAKTAHAYEEYFKILKRNEEVKGRNNPVKKEIEQLITKTEVLLNDQKWKVKFSPVSKIHLLDISRDYILNAQSAVFVSAPFALDKVLVEALGQNDEKIIEYGLCNTTVKNKIAQLNSKNTRFFTPSVLETYMGQKWDAKAFGSHKIHSKTLVVDPWSENPKVIIGTANFSDESCKNNDENFFVIEGDKRLAAIVTTEFVRMWEHYKNRNFINDIVATSGQSALATSLSENGDWSSTAYNSQSRSYKFRERVVFTGGL